MGSNLTSFGADDAADLQAFRRRLAFTLRSRLDHVATLRTSHPQRRAIHEHETALLQKALVVLMAPTKGELVERDEKRLIAKQIATELKRIREAA